MASKEPIFGSDLKAMHLIVLESGDLFTMRNTRRLSFSTPESNDMEKPSEDGRLFECPEPGYQRVFQSFCELEIRAEIGNHGNRPLSESFYDRMRREWAECPTVDPVQADGSSVSCLRTAQNKLQMRHLQI